MQKIEFNEKEVLDKMTDVIKMKKKIKIVKTFNFRKCLRMVKLLYMKRNKRNNDFLIFNF
jgi:hypothetical protein